MGFHRTSLMKLISHTLRTPWVPMSIIVDIENKPIVMAAAFLPLDELVAKAGSPISDEVIRKDAKLSGISDVIRNWIDGEVNAFDSLTVKQPGGPFMQDCWKALRKVRGGKVVSYAQLAQKAGRPQAIRAAGTACSSNLIAPIIPCHRVVRTGGELGNYGFGLELKRSLLVHEGVDL